MAALAVGGALDALLPVRSSLWRPGHGPAREAACAGLGSEGGGPSSPSTSNGPTAGRAVPVRCAGGTGRRKLLAAGATTSIALCTAALAQAQELRLELDGNGLQRIPYQEQGYSFWSWRGHKIGYLAAGDESAEPLLLVHGFGASAYHWRYNVPELAKKYRVFAIDLLGFGWSDKALVEYNATLWREQLADFLREVVRKPAVLAGNSVGGYAVLNTAAFHPDLVRGLVLVNAAGQFDQPGEPDPQDAPLLDSQGREAVVPVPAVGDAAAVALSTPPAQVPEEPLLDRIVAPLKSGAQRALLYLTFLQAKQPGRIKQVLQQVYRNKSHVDEELVRSIVLPAQDANAAEVYYRLTSQVILRSAALPVNRLLKLLPNLPMLLLWGDLDPWMTPDKAQRIVDIYKPATLVHLAAGHCPHDEAPQAANQAMLEWLATL